MNLRGLVMIFNSSYPDVKCGVGDFTAKLAENIIMHTSRQVVVVTSASFLIKPIPQNKAPRANSPQSRCSSGRFSAHSNKLTVLPIVDCWMVKDFLKIVYKLLRYRPEIIVLEYPAVMPSGGYNLTYWLPYITKFFFMPKRMLFLIHEFATTLLENKNRIKRTLLASDEIIVFNNRDLGALIDFLPSIKNKIRVSFIGDNVNKKRWSKKKLLLLKNKLGIYPQAKIITFFGFLHGSEKGFEVLLNALRFLVKKDKTIKLLVVGFDLDDNNKFHTKIKNLIEQNNLSQFILWAGYVKKEELGSYLNFSDIIVLPFKNGAYQNKTTLISALTLGLPVVTTYVKGVTPDYFKNRENMVLVQPNDAKKLASAVNLLLDDKKLAKKIAVNGKILSKRFDWKNVVWDILK